MRATCRAAAPIAEVAETLNRRFVVLTAVGPFVGRSSAVCWSA